MKLLDIFALSGLINGLFVLGLGVFIISHNWRDKLNRLYFLIVIAISIWSFSYWLWLFSNDAVSALFWVRMLSIGSTLIPVFYFHWVVSILKIERRERNTRWLVYILGVLFILFSFSDLFISGVEPKLFFPFWPNPGILYHFYLFVLYICLIIYSSNLLIKSYKIAWGEDKKRLAYVIAGALLAFSGGLSNFFLWYNIPIAPYGNFLVAFYPLLFGYATIKYRLFNIKTIATELFAIAIWIFLFIKILLSTGSNDLLVNIFLFIVVVFFGILLIRSVFKEVRQKEQMEKMAEDVKKAYEAEKRAKERIDEARVKDEALLSSIGIENEKGEAIKNEASPLYQALSSGRKIVTGATGGSDSAESVSSTVSPAAAYYFARGDKTKFPAAVTVAPVVLNGKIIGAVAVFRDVTIERQIDRSKSEFVSLASHQLRTPLTAIKWYSDVLFKEKLSAKQKKCLNGIYDGNERMIKLIDVMLNVSRLEAGKIKINPSPTNVKKILEDIINEQKFTVKTKKQKFIFECPDDLPEISIDQNLVRLIFQNLISNAIKYTPDEGEILCKVEKKNNLFSFEVKDTGIGIPQNQQKRVFEKLFRADNAFSHTAEGNGLGLYAAKMTAESLGGKIWFESKAGKGTTFFVDLPVSPAAK
ncbi:MAG: Multi-sensor signal transduction histidine kinase [Parcubacteria group bacterium GW2011_GWA2_37_10]|nr:MAG: Multi-sensor signal transduction histidine kinase [Parcubacteria group bacterium GW2011_GWA2_37_10]